MWHDVRDDITCGHVSYLTSLSSFPLNIIQILQLPIVAGGVSVCGTTVPIGVTCRSGDWSEGEGHLILLQGQGSATARQGWGSDLHHSTKNCHEQQRIVQFASSVNTKKKYLESGSTVSRFRHSNLHAQHPRQLNILFSLTRGLIRHCPFLKFYSFLQLLRQLAHFSNFCPHIASQQSISRFPRVSLLIFPSPCSQNPEHSTKLCIHLFVWFTSFQAVVFR